MESTNVKNNLTRIFTDLTKQLNEGAITNQNMVCSGYIPIKTYDCGLITHFAIIENNKNLIPNSVTELIYDIHELYAYDKDHKIVFDLSLDEMIDEKRLTRKLLRKFHEAFEKYYDTYVYETEEE